VQPLLDWLTGLPPVALYLALAVVAGIENVFPPFPADTVVAFGAFLAARGEATLLGVILATWVGNVAGAMLMYALGRRFGAEAMARRLGGKAAFARFERFHARYGMASLFLSRFLPGVRAVVPPVAGALRIPAVRAGLLMAAASAIWYGTIAVIAFRVGDDWERLRDAVGSSVRTMGLVATIVVVVALVVLWMRRRRTRSDA
jgi:membrane protein DedA with SNARE-associated domain